MAPRAAWWRVGDDGTAACVLCPNACRVVPGGTGLCGVRRNVPAGQLPYWGFVTSAAVDPIEKKPLYHFLPGSSAFSVGFRGCNLDCPFCQNHRISKDPSPPGSVVGPARLASMAVESGAPSVAFTYSEPTVHFEYLLEAAAACKSAGLRTVLVTNGHLNRKPARALLALMDAANVDLKSWDPAYYRDVLKGDQAAVKAFIEESAALCWTEVTTLVVPGDNDAAGAMDSQCRWLASVAGSDGLAFHLSAYHPSRSYSEPPTSPASLDRLGSVAKERLDFVYTGNLGRIEDTVCPACGAVAVRRGRPSDGVCPGCGNRIPGVYA